MFLGNSQNRLRDIHQLLINSLAKSPEKSAEKSPLESGKKESEPAKNVSFINETKNLLNNRPVAAPETTPVDKLTHETILPMLDKFLARLESSDEPNGVNSNDDAKTKPAPPIDKIDDMPSKPGENESGPPSEIKV